MKKVVFILVALMAVAFTSCSQELDSKYVHYVFKYTCSEDDIENDIHIPYYKALEDLENGVIDSIEFRRIGDSLNVIADSYCDEKKDRYESYNIYPVLKEFGIDVDYYKKLQDTYGKSNVQLFHREDIGIREYEKTAWIWIEVYGETIYDTTFMWDLAEMKWVGIEFGTFWENF